MSVCDSNAPLVFILGAGCSISSGAPSTPEAFRHLDSGLQRHEQRERSFAPDQSVAEKRAVLRPAFEGFAPGIGYLLLASLARSRRVYIVNFNWDLGVEMAAQHLGVNCKSFEPGNRFKWGEIQLSTRQPGLCVLHVHGRLDGNPLCRITETSQFPEDMAAVLEKLWKFHKVCLGVDLGYELDFFSLSTAAKQARVSRLASLVLLARRVAGRGASPEASANRCARWPADRAASAVGGDFQPNAGADHGSSIAPV